ncbi:MAG: sulfurtransferase TusA family protein [Desulfovibrionaceae bacterium]
MTMIDTRGLSCPQPVLMVLKAVKNGDTGPFTVLVDNDCSLENVTRAAQNRGFRVEASPVERATYGEDGLTLLQLTH